jgi:3-dehydroquinate synthase
MGRIEFVIVVLLLLDELQIKSSKNGYTVKFYENLTEINNSSNVFIVDNQVYSLLENNFKKINEDKLFILDALEENKTLQTSEKLIEFLLQRKFKRNHQLIVIGGGIVQDIVCFTASIFQRGVSRNFIPTTLLAQADSCIGGKSSIILIT